MTCDKTHVAFVTCLSFLVSVNGYVIIIIGPTHVRCCTIRIWLCHVASIYWLGWSCACNVLVLELRIASLRCWRTKTIMSFVYGTLYDNSHPSCWNLVTIHICMFFLVNTKLKHHNFIFEHGWWYYCNKCSLQFIKRKRCVML